MAALLVALWNWSGFDSDPVFEMPAFAILKVTTEGQRLTSEVCSAPGFCEAHHVDSGLELIQGPVLVEAALVEQEQVSVTAEKVAWELVWTASAPWAVPLSTLRLHWQMGLSG
jgi:hypothetical protein